ncbi:MAG: GNAT family N-acetyltransferase [Pirellulaceae bacterium]|nr:GNAT family N-acetyltransferase [Pirellulaceae bacterium]
MSELILKHDSPDSAAITSVACDCLVRVKTPAELTCDEWQVWESLRTTTKWLDSPFFAADFVRAVAHFNPAVRIAVLRDQESIVGFWPFEVQRRSGRPVASLVTELTGLIFDASRPLNLGDVLPAMGLHHWRFDCVPETQSAFSPFIIRNMSSSFISLQDGYDSYRESLLARNCRQFAENARKSRKLERERGPLSWVWHQADSKLLDELIRWKRIQYRRTGMLDVLGVPAVRDLLRHLLEQASERFGGVMAALSVAGQPIAIHYGLRDNRVMASWFHAYDPTYAAFSPGRIVMHKLIEDATAYGIERIDLGQGDERYKASLSNGSLTVGEGIVCQKKLDQMLLSAWIRAREVASSNSYFRMPLKWIRNMRGRQKGVAP